MKIAPSFRQRGATLIVALIVLVLLTLFAVNSFNIGKGSLQTVGNAQSRNEAMAAAQQAVEEAVSTTRLFKSPGAVILGDPACEGGAPNTQCVDVNGDGNTDVTVRLDPQPTCVGANAILNNALDPSNPNDAGCFIQAGQSFGVAGANTGSSLCADSLWDVNARADDTVTGASYTVTQGVGVRVAADDIAANCP
jgi:Tfp pilus assembly protein FimT